MAAKVFTDLLLKAKFEGMPIHGDRARKWFKRKVKEVAGKKLSPRDIMVDAGPSFRNTVYPGSFYMFYYDPKWKHTLPYYDRFPIVLVLHVKGDRFLGLNFHYLPHPLRAKLLDALYELKTTKSMTENTKIKATYSLLKSAAKYKYFRPTIKWYLKDHVRSRFVKVKPSEWEIALFLHVEQFERGGRGNKGKWGGKIHKYEVWKQSRKQISRW